MYARRRVESTLKSKGLGTSVGDEGGLAPNLKANVEAIEVILAAIGKAGFTAGKDIVLALDPAASEFYEDGAYVLAKSIAVLALVFVAGGLTLAFEDTLEGTIAAVDVPRELRGSGFGALAAVNGVGDLVSSAMVGVAWSVIGAPAAFAAAGVLCALGTVALTAHVARARR